MDVSDFVDPKDSNVLGETRPSRLTIVVRPGLPPDLERVVVWHEVLHAVMAVHDWLGARRMPAEEEVVDKVSMTQMEVLRDNPRLLRYLTAP